MMKIFGISKIIYSNEVNNYIKIKLNNFSTTQVSKGIKNNKMD